MVDLSVRYLGLDLRSPIVASASPNTRDVDRAKAMAASGVGAIVMPSLFEEEILHDQVELNRGLESGSGHFAEALDYFPAVDELLDTGDHYLADLEKVTAAVDVPVIASLNATHPGSWTKYARQLADAGAAAMELNLYHLAAEPDRTAADHEASDLAIVAEVRAEIDIPLAVKLSPYYSAFANFAAAVVDAGADGLVLFNRFYQPDIDLEDLEVISRVELSDPSELRLPLRWIAILFPQLAGKASLAATSGIWRGTDVVKAVMVGADVAMTTSALLRHGAGHVATLESELVHWLTEQGYDSVDQLRGSASRTVAGENAPAVARANYLRTLHSWTTPSHRTS